MPPLVPNAPGVDVLRQNLFTLLSLTLNPSEFNLGMKWWITKLDQLSTLVTMLGVMDFKVELAQNKVTKEELNKAFDGPKSVGAILKQGDGEVPVLNGIGGDEGVPPYGGTGFLDSEDDDV